MNWTFLAETDCTQVGTQQRLNANSLSIHVSGSFQLVNFISPWQCLKYENKLIRA